MKIDFFCPRWGSEGLQWNEFAEKIANDGYVGVEVYPLGDESTNQDMLSALEEKNLSYILLHAEMKEGKNFEKYLEALERNLYRLLDYQNQQMQPRFIVTQTGREYYSMDQMEQCFAICNRIAKESGIEIIQETHRNKWSYAAHVVKDYLARFPELKLALDLSHWVCVSESYLEDQQDAVDLAIQHTRHIHARVGHTQGPQVLDPSAPENREALQHHLNWWDRWVSRLDADGVKIATITPEFGPYPYLPFKPFTKEPISDQYAVNLWMMNHLKKRYEAII
ncbi:sugar phosphate isomerase/epimerase family protein [Sphingobacterium corticis]|uniref:Sugar phosphate isomerase/epimerase family protein n=1 Tax=Sphingobacterium corticis TaxID=1812823 RepID=A0ABW5NK99_9SPHI